MLPFTSWDLGTCKYRGFFKLMRAETRRAAAPDCLLHPIQAEVTWSKFSGFFYATEFVDPPAPLGPDRAQT